MLIKKFVGADEKSLLKKIRSELGPEAVILHSSFQKRSGIWKLLGRDRVEIVAGKDFKIVKDYASGSPQTRSMQAPTPTAILQRVYEAAAPLARQNDFGGQPEPLSPEALRKEINEIKAMIARQGEIIKQKKFEGCPPDLQEEYLTLTQNHLSEGLAQRVIQRIIEKLGPGALKDRVAVRESVRASLKDFVKCADGIALQDGKCVRVAFIGPTGVGKTTTIAKLISIYVTKFGKEVAVITNDTYRIAATEQIKRVAQIVGVPVRICRDPREIEAAVAEFSNRDLVLVDTAGRSQKNSKHLQELNRVLAAIKPNETHLVVSMTTHPETMLDVIQNFSGCSFDRVVLTKMDEAVKVGLVLDVLTRIQKELSFITTGQEIPRDIEIADSGRLASLILGEERV